MLGTVFYAIKIRKESFLEIDIELKFIEERHFKFLSIRP